MKNNETLVRETTKKDVELNDIKCKMVDDCFNTTSKITGFVFLSYAFSLAISSIIGTVKEHKLEKTFNNKSISKSKK